MNIKSFTLSFSPDIYLNDYIKSVAKFATTNDYLECRSRDLVRFTVSLIQIHAVATAGLM